MLDPDFEKLSFEKAVQLFKGWGFLVEFGPRTSEVTLILDGAAHRTYCVCEPRQLSEMAAAVLRMRWHIGSMTATVRDMQ
jgi:hypothetical protein